ncbi:hypothetical protein FIBSPDRAFT_1036681 [Athelia psychrophila]|uniref:Uncharacterized protein n=1 Tax=Athelia psychrophila TaxID=1759441 RepID=A0A166VAU1_9AGAM|nr:hypothetical protein FIBSPDRAFT_1036681 [Fibularhizoctonia sp. CBS 109695]
MNQANIRQAMQPNPEFIRLRSLAQRSHDASALASFIERSKPSLAINIFDVLSWICEQVASDHVKLNPSCLFAQSLLRCIEAINTHAGRGRAGFLEMFPNVITNPGNIWICVQDIHERVVNDVNLETSARLLTAAQT